MGFWEMVNINFESFINDAQLYEYMNLKKEWDAILDETIKHLYGDMVILPCDKGIVRLSAFSQLSDVSRMYLCGAFTPAQFQEITQFEEEVYCDRDTLLRQECKSQQEYERKSEEMENISFKEVQEHIHHPVFSNIAMDFYIAAKEKMVWATQLCDMCGPNFGKFYIDLDEPQRPYSVYKEGNIFESDADAADFLIGIRNGCAVRNERLDFILSFLSHRLYAQAIQALQTLPETKATKGAYMRGIFASSYFLKLYDPEHIELETPTELLIHEAINISKECVKKTYDENPEWAKFQCDYIDATMHDYYVYRIADKLTEEISFCDDEKEQPVFNDGKINENNPVKITSQKPDIQHDDKSKKIGD